MENQTVQSLKEQLERLNNIEYALRRTITMRKLYGKYCYDVNLQVIFPDSLSPSPSNTSTDRIQSLSEDELREREEIVEQMASKVQIKTEPISSETDLNASGFSRKDCIEKIMKLDTGMSESDVESIVSEFYFQNEHGVDNNNVLTSSHSSEDNSSIRNCSYNNSGSNSEVEYLHQLSPYHNQDNSVFRGSTKNKYCRMSPPKDGPNRNVFMIKEKSRPSSTIETIHEHYSKHDKKTEKTGRFSNDSDTSNTDNCKGYASNIFDSQELTCSERKCTSIRDSLRNIASGISTNTFDAIDPIPTSDTATIFSTKKFPSASVSNYINNHDSSSNKEEFDDSLSEKSHTEQRRKSAEKETKKKKKLLKKISKKNVKSSATTSETKTLSVANNRQNKMLTKTYENSKLAKKPSKNNMLFANNQNIESDNSEENYPCRERNEESVEEKPSKNNLLFNRIKTPYYAKKRFQEIAKMNQQKTDKNPSNNHPLDTKQNTQYYKENQFRNYSRNHQQMEAINISKLEKKSSEKITQNVENTITPETAESILTNESYAQENCDSQANEKLSLETKNLFTDMINKYRDRAIRDVAANEFEEQCQKISRKKQEIEREKHILKYCSRFSDLLEKRNNIPNDKKEIKSDHCDEESIKPFLPVLKSSTNENKENLKESCKNNQLIENEIKNNSDDKTSLNLSTSFNVWEEIYKQEKCKKELKKTDKKENNFDDKTSSSSTISVNTWKEIFMQKKLKRMELKRFKKSDDSKNCEQDKNVVQGDKNYAKKNVKECSKSKQLIGKEIKSNCDNKTLSSKKSTISLNEEEKYKFIEKKGYEKSGDENNYKNWLKESDKTSQLIEKKITNNSGDERINEKSLNTSYEICKEKCKGIQKEESNKSGSSKTSGRESLFCQGDHKSQKFSDYHKKYLLPLQEKLQNLESFLLRGQNAANKLQKKSSNPSSDDCKLTNHLKLNCEPGQQQSKDQVDKPWEEGDGIALVRTCSTANLLKQPLDNSSEFTFDSKTKSNVDSGIVVSVNDLIPPQRRNLKQVFFVRKFDTQHKTISVSPQIINFSPVRNITVQTTKKKLQFMENMELKFIVSPKQLHSSSSENSLHTQLQNKNDPLEERPKMIRIKNNKMKFVNFPPSHTSISSNFSESGSDDNSSGQKAIYGFVRIKNIRKMVRRFIRKQ